MLVFSTMMFSTGMFMLMVRAVNCQVVIKISASSLYSLVCWSEHPSESLIPISASAFPGASMIPPQIRASTFAWWKTGQRAMSLSISVNYLTSCYFTVLNIISLNCSVSKMLKNLSAFVSYCDSHCKFPFHPYN